MKVRALDGNGDFSFGLGASYYLTGNMAISQMIQTNLRSFLGDCFFDVTAGVDWFTLLGGKNQVALEFAVRASILNTPGVQSITELSIARDQYRNVSIIYSVATVYPGAFTGTTDLLLDESGNILTDENGDPLHA